MFLRWDGGGWGWGWGLVRSKRRHFNLKGYLKDLKGSKRISKRIRGNIYKTHLYYSIFFEE